VQVSLLARGATLAALQHHGLRLRSGDAEQHYRLPATSDAGTLGVQDLVVVAVKAPALPDIARSIGPLLGPTRWC
jgi:2-dehydropantoate 2-reductase